MNPPETDLLAEIKKKASVCITNVLEQLETSAKDMVDTLAKHGASFGYDGAQSDAALKLLCSCQEPGGCKERLSYSEKTDLSEELTRSGWSYIGRPPGHIRCPEHSKKSETSGGLRSNRSNRFRAAELRYLLDAHPVDIRGAARRRLQERLATLEGEANES